MGRSTNADDKKKPSEAPVDNAAENAAATPSEPEHTPDQPDVTAETVPEAAPEVPTADTPSAAAPALDVPPAEPPAVPDTKWVRFFAGDQFTVYRGNGLLLYDGNVKELPQVEAERLLKSFPKNFVDCTAEMKAMQPVENKALTPHENK